MISAKGISKLAARAGAIERIRAAMTLLGWSQIDAAEHLGVAPGSLRVALTGDERYAPMRERLEVIIRAEVEKQ